MKSESHTRTGSLRYDEHPHPSFSSPAIASRDSDEVLKLKTENVRLQRLVAELLIENQELRQKHCGSRRDAEGAAPSAAHNHHRGDN